MADKKDEDVEICPKCHKKIAEKNQARDLVQTKVGFGPLGGRIICGKCKYIGLPIVVSKKLMEKIKDI